MMYRKDLHVGASPIGNQVSDFLYDCLGKQILLADEKEISLSQAIPTKLEPFSTKVYLFEPTLIVLDELSFRDIWKSAHPNLHQRGFERPSFMGVFVATTPHYHNQPRIVEVYGNVK